MAQDEYGLDDERVGKKTDREKMKGMKQVEKEEIQDRQETVLSPVA